MHECLQKIQIFRSETLHHNGNEISMRIYTVEWKSTVFDWIAKIPFRSLRDGKLWMEPLMNRAFTAGVIKIRAPLNPNQWKCSRSSQTIRQIVVKRGISPQSQHQLLLFTLSDKMIEPILLLTQLKAIDAINLCYSIWWVHNSITNFSSYSRYHLDANFSVSPFQQSIENSNFECTSTQSCMIEVVVVNIVAHHIIQRRYYLIIFLNSHVHWCAMNQ